MISLPQAMRGSVPAFSAIAAVLILYDASRVPSISVAERKQLASRFDFHRYVLPSVESIPTRTLRGVHPSLREIAAWISSVGAAVALNDIDGDGLPNDVCLVDARADRVVIAPVPSGRRRFDSFVLEPSKSDIDASTIAPMGCLVADIDEDGLTDVLVYYWGRTPVAFLRKTDQTLRVLTASSYVPTEIVDKIQRWYTSAMTLADVDGDGHIDAIVGNYFPDGARILDVNARGTQPMQRSMSRAKNSGRHHILIWEPVGAGAEKRIRFDDVDAALPNGSSFGWTLAVGAADLDGDLLPELYFANDFGPDQLFHNCSRPKVVCFTQLEGRKSFTTPSSKVIGRDSFKGMGVDFSDINLDGYPDIFVSAITVEYGLQESQLVFVSTGEIGAISRRIAPYVDRSETLGLSRSGFAWDVKVADLDNDGFPEVLQATGFIRGKVDRWPELQELAMGNDELLHNPRVWPRFAGDADISGSLNNPFFVRAGDGRYYNISKELGFREFGVSRGIAPADVDGDGDLDFAIANQWARSTFYHNVSPKLGQVLELSLRLPLGAKSSPTTVEPGMVSSRDSRAAIGASAMVTLPDGKTLVGQVDGGNGHSGKRSPHLHFGLGRAPRDTALRTVLRWRSADGSMQQDTLKLRPGVYTVFLESGPQPTAGVR